MTYKYDHAVYIGRFQPIHRAHLKSIALGLDKAKTLIILVGSAKRPSDIRNPWSYDERVSTIKDAIQEYFNEDVSDTWTDYPKESILNRIIFAPLRDYFYSNNKWASEAFTKATALGAVANQRKTVLIGARKDDTSFYLDMFQSWSFDEHNVVFDNLSAVDVRYALFANGNVDNEKHIMDSTKKYLKSWMVSTDSDFIKGEWEFHKAEWKKYEHLPFGYTAITGDAVIIKSGCVLLIKRGHHPGKGLWAFPGGYVNKGEWITPGTLREVKEETRISVPIPELEKSIKSVQFFDAPNRSLRGRLVTFAHVIDLGYGPLPYVSQTENDDAAGAYWVSIQDALQMEDLMMEDHYDILIKTISDY